MIALLQLIRGAPPDPALNESGWRSLLEVADRALSTALLRNAPSLPPWIALQVESRITKIAQRRRRLVETYGEVEVALKSAGIDFVLLKGFTHETGFGVAPELRVQNDIDLWCLPTEIERARDALLNAGFIEHHGPELSDNHVRPLLKPHNWAWRGDYFDPEMPVVVELHHSLWNSRRDRIATPGLDDFWRRRATLGAIPALAEPDRLGFAALHVLRHILRNNLRPAHAFELACALQFRREDHAFWSDWQNFHSSELRSLQAVAFQFASRWFETELPDAVQSEWDRQPGKVHDWFERYAFSPVLNLSEPNKDVLWLHLALLPRWQDRARVLRRRLVPLRLPKRAEASNRSYAAHLMHRAGYHAAALMRAMRTASHTSD